MSNLREEPLEINFRIPESCPCLGRGLLELRGKFFCARNDAHAAAAAASACFQEQRKSKVVRD